MFSRVDDNTESQKQTVTSGGYGSRACKNTCLLNWFVTPFHQFPQNDQVYLQSAT